MSDDDRLADYLARMDNPNHAVNADTGTVEITTESLAQILRDAGWTPDDA